MVHRCHAARCRTVVPERLLMCARHWALVPAGLQAAIYRLYTPGQERTKRPSIQYLAAATAAIETVARTERTTANESGPAAERNQSENFDQLTFGDPA